MCVVDVEQRIIIRTGLAVGPGPSSLSGLSSTSWTLSGRSHDALHDLVCSIVSTGLCILHRLRPCLHTATCVGSSKVTTVYA